MLVQLDICCIFSIIANKIQMITTSSYLGSNLVGQQKLNIPGRKQIYVAQNKYTKLKAVLPLTENKASMAQKVCSPD
jgi:hypothetical protein